MDTGISLGNFDTQLGIVYSHHASLVLGKDHWVVKKQFHFAVDGNPDKVVVVPKGYLTDGATVPRLFWGLVPPWGEYGQAAVLHDYLCEYLTYQDYGATISVTRKEADLIFKRSMEELNVGVLTCSTMYAAVRVYAGLSKLRRPKVYHRKRGLEKEMLNVFNQTGIWI